MASRPTVHSFYRYNIEQRLLDAQRRVFDHFDVPLNQWRDDKANHAGWIDALLADDSLDDIVVIADIDAFPLSHEAYAGMVAAAERGAIAGLAQTTNDKRPDRIFAAPMFMAFRRDVWRDFGAPSLAPYETGDVAQILTDIAEARGVEVALTYPSFALRPIWPLADRGVYGTGTFYGDMDFFHLYQARHVNTVDLFCAVADGAIAGRHDWAAYLGMIEAAPPEAKGGRSLRQIIRKLRG
ncbi:hypothetical protein [uncultured Tateyamaria sp.]|uniref:hypothetical protein n=1 Tax=Tateyamaria sp. 1078 TaxID=3417464 RepID=UPI0026320D09|nr:hypothetical protein [uncultured Tateyamaria sp.]